MCTKCSPTLEYMHFLFRHLREFIWSPSVYIDGPLCIYLSVSHSAVLPVQFCGQLIHHYCRLGRASTWEHPVMRHTHTHMLPATHEYIFHYHAPALCPAPCSLIFPVSHHCFLLSHDCRNKKRMRSTGIHTWAYREIPSKGFEWNKDFPHLNRENVFFINISWHNSLH